MEQRKITLRQEFVTPEAAQSIVLHEMYERQRPVDQGTVITYALAMKRAEWRQGTVLSFTVYEGKRSLINGQHTCWAIAYSEAGQWCTIEEIEVESLDERDWWFSKYDRVRLRSLRQIYHASQMDEVLNFNKHQTVCLGACLPLLASGFSQAPRQYGGMRMYNSNPQLRMAFMREWQDEAGRFFAVIKGAPAGLSMNIRRAPVMSVALVTIRFTSTDAEEFWQNVCQDDGLMAGDPRKVLHVFLRTTKPSRYEPHVYSRYIAAAWNSAWNTRSIKTIQPQLESRPISLEGTPHNGRNVLRYVSPEGDPLKEPLVYKGETWQIAFDLSARRPEA